MKLCFNRDCCHHLATIETAEWLVTNGIGGYASGTVAGLLTRRYHGLLVAALNPPLGRTLLLTKLEERVSTGGQTYELSTNRWADGAINPVGYHLIDHFELDGTLPRWQFALGDSQLEKRLWMEPGANTTYLSYAVLSGGGPMHLTLHALINYRDYHGDTRATDWPIATEQVSHGIKITAFAGATPLYLLADRGEISLAYTWYYGFDLAVERYRGLTDREDHLQAATLTVTLQPGESVTLVASTEPAPDLDGASALKRRRGYEQSILALGTQLQPTAPNWVQQLRLAADQFIVQRATPVDPGGKTIIAGYPWFSDWGRDTMIALPGLTLATGRPDIARSILLTFAQHMDRGMLPNRFPDAGEVPEYNTVDATLWYFQAVRAYHAATGDDQLLTQLYPVLADSLAWHQRGTRYHIQMDADDGLLYAGEPGVQLTWMDAKVGDWVVTPRIGKPVEVNALWYGALRSQAHFARHLGYPSAPYDTLANQAAISFCRFWNPSTGYCYDVLDGPDGDDPTLRPNQIFAVSLPDGLLSSEQQRRIVEVCQTYLLTPVGLRSLSPSHPHYQGHYGGDQRQRDGAYHQGTVWGWLLGPFALAHWRVYQNPAEALAFLEGMIPHLSSHGLGTISEIFDGDPPFTPRGCLAQAWSVAETLRVWAELGR
ncbi:MAG: glycogen debranching protein [Leptolyngbyaceae cyanobacterium SM2_5_2]|nr:glycogen debranching protein [Leptolyngbyaceae cyanobacterium SM2_5_2]